MIRRGSGCRTIAMILPVSVCLWFSVSTTAALTVTPSPTQQGSITLTRTPTPSPTSCGVETPIVDPVLSPTTLLQQTITGMARVTGARSVSITSEGGIARMDCNEGECGFSFALTINLLPNQTNHLTVVNIALGNESASVCPGVDQWYSSGPAGVTINCIIVAVNNALYGCGGRLPTPTPGASDCCQCTVPFLSCGLPVNGSCGPTCSPVSRTACTSSGTCAMVTPTPLRYQGYTCCECENTICADFAYAVDQSAESAGAGARSPASMWSMTRRKPCGGSGCLRS
jgi:hypothetical protein